MDEIIIIIVCIALGLKLLGYLIGKFFYFLGRLCGRNDSIGDITNIIFAFFRIAWKLAIVFIVVCFIVVFIK